MNKIFGSVLAGVSGSLKSYSTMQKEQRAFNMEQQAATADMERKQNFARFGKSLEKSGMVRKDTGESLTNEQLALMGPEERKNLESQQDRTFRQGQEEADAKTLSQWMDPETKEQLTNAQVKQYKEEGRKMVTVTAHKEERQDEVTAAKQEVKEQAAAELNAMKAELAEAKSDKQFLSTFRSQLNKSLDPEASAAENHMAVGQLINVMSDDPRIDNEKMVREYKDVEGIAGDIMHANNTDMSIEETKALLKKAGHSDKKIQTAIEVLKARGQLKEGFFGKLKRAK